MRHKFLIHDSSDSVGVAVSDIKAGEKVAGIFLSDNSSIDIQAANDIPLGHKIALYPVAEGAKVIKYGFPIGIAVRPIAQGEHVHTHNLKSTRW